MFLFFLQLMDRGSLCGVSLEPHLIVCQIVFVMAIAVMRGQWGRCVCWWAVQQPPPLWATWAPAPHPRPWPPEPRTSPKTLGLSQIFPQEAPCTPAAKMWTHHISIALTLKETPILMHLTVVDLHFNCEKRAKGTVYLPFSQLIHYPFVI